MRAARHGILRDTFRGGEVAADKVVRPVTRGGHDHTAAVDSSDGRDVGGKLPYRGAP
jgi:hypothetical protein